MATRLQKGPAAVLDMRRVQNCKTSFKSCASLHAVTDIQRAGNDENVAKCVFHYSYGRHMMKGPIQQTTTCKNVGLATAAHTKRYEPDRTRNAEEVVGHLSKFMCRTKRRLQNRNDKRVAKQREQFAFRWNLGIRGARNDARETP